VYKWIINCWEELADGRLPLRYAGTSEEICRERDKLERERERERDRET